MLGKAQVDAERKQIARSILFRKHEIQRVEDRGVLGRAVQTDRAGQAKQRAAVTPVEAPHQWQVVVAGVGGNRFAAGEQLAYTPHAANLHNFYMLVPPRDTVPSRVSPASPGELPQQNWG